MNYANDFILQKIFDCYRINVLIWLDHIRTMGKWANGLDVLLAAYLLHVNIISVGNYMTRFITNNMQLKLNQILGSNDYHITESSTIYVYFHIFQKFIVRMSDGNHYAYMHPIPYIPDSIFRSSNGDICIYVDREYFKFIDVPGDGDCFFTVF